jgi:acetyltransferase EpsM
MNDVVILGTRSFSVELCSIIEEIDDYRVVGFVDNWDRQRMPSTLEGRPVYWIDQIEDLPEDVRFIGGLSTTFRSRFVHAIKEGLPRSSFATIIHPTAHVSVPSSIGEGTFVGVGTIVGSHTRLGGHVLVNRGVLIGHHTEIGDYVTVNPGANIAGKVAVGDHAYIGMGAVIIDQIKIGNHVIVGAGAVVTNDVPDNVMVVGVPARIVKENIEGK